MPRTKQTPNHPPIQIAQWIRDKARHHGIFLVADDLGKVDFLDTTTGKSLGIWIERPYPRSVVKGLQESGSLVAALKRIVAPYEL
jgi:hypothetical protein